MAILHMQIPDELKVALDDEAARTTRSRTATVVLALRAYLGDQDAMRVTPEQQSRFGQTFRRYLTREG